MIAAACQCRTVRRPPIKWWEDVRRLRRRTAFCGGSRFLVPPSSSSRRCLHPIFVLLVLSLRISISIFYASLLLRSTDMQLPISVYFLFEGIKLTTHLQLIGRSYVPTNGNAALDAHPHLFYLLYIFHRMFHVAVAAAFDLSSSFPWWCKQLCKDTESWPNTFPFSLAGLEAWTVVG